MAEKVAPLVADVVVVVVFVVVVVDVDVEISLASSVLVRVQLLLSRRKKRGEKKGIFEGLWMTFPDTNEERGGRTLSERSHLSFLTV